MAVPVFQAAGTGLVMNGASGTLTHTAFNGRIIIVQVLEDGYDGGGADFSLGTVTFAEDLAGTDGALTQIVGPEAEGGFPLGSPTTVAQQFIYIGRTIGSAIQIVINSAGNDLYGRIYEFSGVSLGTTLADVIEDQASVVGTNASISASSVQTTGSDRLACSFVAVNDDNAVGSFTGESGGDWVEAVAEFLSATGTDGCIQLQTAGMTSAGTISGGSFTMGASDSWGIVSFALKPAALATSFVAARRAERGLVLR